MTYLTYDRDGDVPAHPSYASYGDFSPVKGDYATATPAQKASLYIMPEHLSGSDYNGGSLSKSNYETFLTMYGKREGVYDCHGGMGTFAIVIRADVAEAEDIAETLDYPVLDEDAYRKEQDTREKDAWSGWVERDARNKVEAEVQKFIEDWEPDDSFEERFYDACEETGEYFQEESDGSMYIKVDKLVPNITDKILAEIVPELSLPLLMSRNWKSETAHMLYLSRIKGVPV
jgi:hypothetical protein